MPTKLKTTVKQVPIPPEHTWVLKPEGVLFVDLRQGIKISGIAKSPGVAGDGREFAIKWNEEQTSLNAQTDYNGRYLMTLNNTFNRINCPVALKVTVHNGPRQHNFIIGANQHNGYIYFVVI